VSSANRCARGLTTRQRPGWLLPSDDSQEVASACFLVFVPRPAAIADVGADATTANGVKRRTIKWRISRRYRPACSPDDI
jgi:hypothetical protein